MRLVKSSGIASQRLDGEVHSFQHIAHARTKYRSADVIAPPQARNAPFGALFLRVQVRWERCLQRVLSKGILVQRHWLICVYVLILLVGRAIVVEPPVPSILAPHPAGAVASLLRACAEDPTLRENWIDLTQWYHDYQDWAGCYHACLQALAISERPRHYFSYGYAWGERADDLASVAAWHMGLKDKAAERLRAALAVNPGDQRLQGNARFILDT